MGKDETGGAGGSRRRLGLGVDWETHEGVARIEAFSDGVFAIATTLLVIEIKIPADLPDAPHLVGALTGQWAMYLSYVLSFVYLGIYWAHHHNVFRHFRRSDHIFLKLNILFLMLIALQPFPTAVLGSYLRAEDDRRRVAALLYNGLLLATAAMFLVLWLYAVLGRRLVDRGLSTAFVRATTWRYAVGPVCYAVALGLAYWSPVVSFVIDLAVLVFYLLPLRVSYK